MTAVGRASAGRGKYADPATVSKAMPTLVLPMGKLERCCPSIGGIPGRLRTESRSFELCV